MAFSSHGDSIQKRSGPSTERKQLDLSFFKFGFCENMMNALNFCSVSFLVKKGARQTESEINLMTDSCSKNGYLYPVDKMHPH